MCSDLWHGSESAVSSLVDRNGGGNRSFSRNAIHSHPQTARIHRAVIKDSFSKLVSLE